MAAVRADRRQRGVRIRSTKRLAKSRRRALQQQQVHEQQLADAEELARQLEEEAQRVRSAAAWCSQTQLRNQRRLAAQGRTLTNLTNPR